MSHSYNSNSNLVTIWGVGAAYHKYKEYLEDEYCIEYVYDQKFNTDYDSEYEGYKITTIEDIKSRENSLVIICLYDIKELERIERMLRGCNLKIKRLIDIIPINRALTTDEIKIKINEIGEYKDCYGNRLSCNSIGCIDKISVRFNGRNGIISIKDGVYIEKHLIIECGNDSKIIIGNNTTFDEVIIYSSYADVVLGSDCMLSYGVFIRNHDSHMIFDKISGKRINYCRSINIGDHVWVGQNSTLLSGFRIGGGSIVGASSVSSSEFGENVIIAGSPAKMIRDNIIWDRHMTWTENYDSINELH